MTSSVDSIPDSGMGTLHQSEREILRERITHLEKQLKVSDNVPVLIVMNLSTKYKIEVIFSNVVILCHADS